MNTTLLVALIQNLKTTRRAKLSSGVTVFGKEARGKR